MVGLTYTATKAAGMEAAYQYAVVLMAGNAARWMDSLEVQGHALNSFMEFEKLFTKYYTPLDDKSIARDKLC